MKKWIQKAIVQKIISFFPFKNKINFFFQKHVTKGVFLSDYYFFDRLQHASSHIKAFKKYSKKKFPETSLEIGTGWYPVVPICFFLIGTEQIYSVDITFLTSKKRIKKTLNKIVESYEDQVIQDYIDINSKRYLMLLKLLEDYEKLSLKDILKILNLKYLVEDARKLNIPNNKIDFINSNNTFEHIYSNILKDILLEFKRVLKKEGIMSHFIDMSDHFAHFDKSITIYNFLKYSESQWKLIDNSIQPQNRLRINDYRNIYKDLNIPINEESLREGNMEQLSKLRLNEIYKKSNLEELAVSHCSFISVLY
jgi:ubiquinone/menaquinone biosynthesis C-methylase UbiE